MCGRNSAEIPSPLSPISQQIWDSRYRYRVDGVARDSGVQDTWRRVARALAAVEPADSPTLSGRGEVYYDTITMLVFLLLAARLLEAAARTRAARTLDPLARWMPSFAMRLAGPDAAASAQRIAAHRSGPVTTCWWRRGSVSRPTASWRAAPRAPTSRC